MKKLLLATLFFYSLNFLNAQLASGQFQFNNYSWFQSTNGLMFYDQVNGLPGMEIPVNSQNGPLFSSSLWIGGLDAGENILMTGQRYCSNGCAYKPGPLTVDGSAETVESVSEAFDRFWSVSQSEIDFHLAYFDCLNNPDCDENVVYPDGYDIPESFLSWPAEGDVDLGFAANLAPYYDYNEDGNYNPEQGDHPGILGDFSVFSILNSKDPEDLNSSTPNGFEIHVYVYGFDASEGANFNSLFVQYKIINRSSTTINDTYLGVFNDFDLGNYSDDFIGTDVANSAVYAYNGDDMDEGSASGPGYGDDLPVFGMRILGGPLADSDEIDNERISPEFETYGNQTTGWGDGIIDNERLGLSGSISFFGDGPSATQDPQILIEYYNYLKGIWRNGTPLTFGGLGYNPANPEIPEAKYILPGLSDPLFTGTNGIDPDYDAPEGWTEEAEGNFQGDRKSLASSGPFTFEPGEAQYLDLVYIFARDSDFPDSSPFEGFSDYVTQSTSSSWGIQLPDIITSVEDISPESLGFKLYPNPANDLLILESQNHDIGHYVIFNSIGQVVMQGYTTGNRTTLSVDELPSGMYLLRYEVAGKAATQKLVVE